MKNFQGNPRLGGCLRSAGAGIGLMALLALPAAAQQYPSTAPGSNSDPQQQGPVDLLATIQDNTSAAASGEGSDDITFSLDNSATLQGLTPVIPTINSIDEAVEAVTELPVQMVPATSQPTSAVSLIPQSDNETASAADAAVTAADNADVNVGENATAVTLPATLSAAGLASTAAGDDALADNSTVEASGGSVVSLQKRAAPRFGVAAIGVESRSGLNATIWRNTSADRAAMLLDSEMAMGASPSLSALAHDVVAQRAVPPVGGEAMADDLVAARLEWLAAAGRSQTLENIVNQLPNDPPWLGWKQWLVETQLMSRRDEDACRTVMYQVSRTFEPFWHKAKVICSAATGDVAGAQFAADILTAMGVDDPVFTALVAQLLTDRDPGPIDPSLLEPLHVVLMDAAHAAIDVDGLAALSNGSVETAVGLRYLDADARLVSTWRALDRGLVDHGKAAKLWRSAKSEPDVAALALARHQSQPSPLTRALVWRALDNDKTVLRLPMITQALDADIASGAGLMMAPLYAELSREGLGFDGASQALAADPVLAARMAMLMGVGDADALPAPLDNDISQAVRGLLLMAAGGEADMASLAALDLWHLLPLVAGQGETVADTSWLDLAMPEMAPASFLSLSPPMLRALEQAAAEDRVAEAVLLAHRMVGTLDLSTIHPSDVARIATVLNQIGQSAVAAAFAGEVATAHILAAMREAGDVAPILLPAIIDANADVDVNASAVVPESVVMDVLENGAAESSMTESDAAVPAVGETGASETGTSEIGASETEAGVTGALAPAVSDAPEAVSAAVTSVDNSTMTAGTNADTTN